MSYDSGDPVSVLREQAVLFGFGEIAVMEKDFAEPQKVIRYRCDGQEGGDG